MPGRRKRLLRQSRFWQDRVRPEKCETNDKTKTSGLSAVDFHQKRIRSSAACSLYAKHSWQYSQSHLRNRSMWLSCYPRSGSSFLRLILNQAFGLRSTSLYEGESARWDIAPGVADLVGHYERGARTNAPERNSADRFEIVKTNEPPLDDAPAIYLSGMAGPQSSLISTI